jgi:hypothetical protein
MLHTPFFSLQNAVYFMMLLFLVPVLFAFYIQGVLKFKFQILAFADGFQKLYERCQPCAVKDGDYFEGQ